MGSLGCLRTCQLNPQHVVSVIVHDALRWGRDHIQTLPDTMRVVYECLGPQPWMAVYFWAQLYFENPPREILVNRDAEIPSWICERSFLPAQPLVFFMPFNETLLFTPAHHRYLLHRNLLQFKSDLAHR